MLQKYIKITFVSLLTLSSLSSLSTFSQESTSIGLSIGTPAGVNFVIKSDALGVPLQISGAYLGDKVSGIEVGYSFYEHNDSFFYSAQLIAGYSHIETNQFESDTWRYAGASATFKKGGFFMEPGLTFGSGDYSNPQLTFQIGWLWDL
jgi:hypothetical protein